MKKRLAVIAVAAICALLAGCGSDNKSDDAGDNPTTSASDTSTTPTDDTSTDATTSSDDEGGGSDPGSGYCDDIKSVKKTFESKDFTDGLTQAKFDSLQEVAQGIAAEAPADVQDDWQTFVDALDQLESILSDAGITFDDFDNLQAGQLPGDMTVAQAQQLGKDLNSFAKTSHISEASKAISKSIKSTCGISTD